MSTYLARRVCWTCGILTDHLHEATARLDQPGRRVAA